MYTSPNHTSIILMDREQPTFRIKNIIAAQGLTVKGLAEKIGVTPQHLSAVINEKGSPTVATLNKIAEALDVPVAALFTDYLTPSQSVAICPHCGGRINIKTGKSV